LSNDIFIADYKRTTVLQFPTIPSELPSLSASLKNEEFETYWNGTFNFIEQQGLYNFTLSGTLPVDASKYYYFKSKVNAIEIINLINKIIEDAEPIRITITGDGYVNNTFSIESWSYNIKQNGDYAYSLGVKLWREYTTTIATTTTTIGWGQDSTGWYYYTDTAGTYYKDAWQLIDNEWYSFDSQGYARESVWFKDGSYWYYLKYGCKMARNEWVTIDGKSYYLGDGGGMYVGSYTPDGYWVGSDGEWVE